MSSSNGTAVCVLGMHRSGTSSAARCLNLLGAYLGEQEQLYGPREDNPEGFWERKDVVDFHERLLSVLSLRWDTALPLPAGWQSMPEVAPFFDELRRLIDQNFMNVDLWGWKDPRTCLFLDMWKDVLAARGTSLKVLYVVRDPRDVAMSLMKRDGFDLHKSFGIWYMYNLSALASVKDVECYFIDYDSFLENSVASLQKCAAGLNIHLSGASDSVLSSINNFMNPSLRHSKNRDMDIPRYIEDLNSILLDMLLNDSNKNKENNYLKVSEYLNRHCEASSFYRSDLSVFYNIQRNMLHESVKKKSFVRKIFKIVY